MFPGQPALGQRVRIGIQPRRQDVEIIGVVDAPHIYDLKDPNLAGVYVPSVQEPDLVDGKCLIIRGSGALLQAIQAPSRHWASKPSADRRRSTASSTECCCRIV